MINKANNPQSLAESSSPANAALETPGADAAAFHEGYLRVEGQVKSVPLGRLVPINFDVRGVVTTVLGVCPELFELRSEIAKLPVSMPLIDQLKDYALALGYAHSRFTLTLDNDDDLAALGAEGVVVRDQLHADAAALAKRGILRSEYMTRFRSGNGYRNVAFDLAGLAEVFVDAWDKLEGKTFLTREHVEHARQLGARMVQLLGEREQGPVRRDQAAILRQQAYVLCAEAYEEARHAVAFVRRKEGDVDSITPLLFAGRGGRPSQSEGAAAPAGPVPVAEPSPPLTGSTASADAIPAGHPGAAPFVRS